MPSITSQPTLLVAQLGGPTPVVNASLAALIAESRRVQPGVRILGARHGIEGVLLNEIVDLSNLSSEALEQMATMPGAALGSSRHPLHDEDETALLATLQRHCIGQFVAIGGNGAMRALAQAAKLIAVTDQSVQLIGVPKTVDNDLAATDFAPGYGSAARFLALATRDAGLDLEAMATFDDVVVLEVMGRHTGWLAAATALARPEGPVTAPHLILMPERPFDPADLLDAIAEIHDAVGHCFIVVSEGVRDRSGSLYGQAGHDALGRPILGLARGAGDVLAALIAERTGFQARCFRPGSIGRALSVTASEADRAAATQVGAAAARALAAGQSGAIVTLVRQGGGPASRWETGLAPLTDVAGQERPLPDDFIAASGMDVTPAFLDYAQPLVGALPPPFRLQAHRVP